MRKLSRIITYLGFPIFAILLLTKSAYADSSLAVMAYSGSPVGTISIYTLGIGFVVVFIIETVIIKRVAGVNWTAAWNAALVINLVSTIFGALTAFIVGTTSCFFIFLLPLTIIGFWIALWLLKYSRGFIALVVLCSASGIIAAYLLMESAGLSIAGLWACIIVQLIFGFGMSLFFEVISIGRFIPREKIERSVLLANVGSYVFLLLMVPFFWPNPILVSSRTVAGMKSWLLRDGEGKEAAMILYRKDLTTAELLGLKKIDAGNGSFDATEMIGMAEGELLETALEKTRPGPASGQHTRDTLGSIVEYSKFAQSIPNLQDPDKRDLQWLSLSATMWKQVSSAMFDGDAEKAKHFYLEWRKGEDDIKSPRYGEHENKFDPLFWMHTLAVERYVNQDVKDMVDELIAEYGLAQDDQPDS